MIRECGGKAWQRRVCVGLLIAVAWLQGCSSLPPVAGPSMADMKRAARAAAMDPNTWLPAMGATLVLAADRDRAWSDWARRERPVFGSTGAARRGSDVLLYTSLGSVLASSLWAGGDGTASRRSSRLPVQSGALAATAMATQVIKVGVGRTRPDDSDDLSFPSGHASAAFGGATLTRRNLARLDLQPAMRSFLDAGAVSLAAATAWARVEAGVHYPSDVLAGAALGNFVTAFVNDAWLRGGGPAGSVARVGVLPLRGGAVLKLTWRYY